MGVNLDILVGYRVPIDESELLRLPERLSAPIFREVAESLLEAAVYPGVGTAAERAEFCTWHWQDPGERRWFWSRRSWPDEVRRRAKVGLAPTMRWAGFHVDFYRLYARLTHIEKYGAFLQGKRYRLPAESGLQHHLRRCCRVFATTFGTCRALYLPDSGNAPVQIARKWAAEGLSFDAIASRLEREFGEQPPSLSACGTDDYFIDDFAGLGQ
jgi:hypothetical protein